MDAKELRKEINAEEIVKAAARKRLINFARYVRTDFQAEPFHRVYYEILDKFAHGKIKRLIIQQPPQHGKSEGSSRNLPAFLLGLDPNLKICICSYAATIARDFNRDVQRIMASPEYADIFPDSSVVDVRYSKKGNSYRKNIDVTELYGSRGWLRAVGRGGALTSKSVDIAILDDVYKDYAEGNSPIIREAAWKWYTTVVRTRLHNDSRELIVFTRWNEDDLIGRISKQEKVIDAEKWEDFNNIPEGAWVRINFQAIKHGKPTELDPRNEGEALWENRHSAKKLQAQRALDPLQFECLQQGNPGAAEGRLYNPFKVYTNKDDYGEFVRSGCYVDVADSGADYLVAVSYEVRKSETMIFNPRTRRNEPLLFALVTDVIMTQDGADVTAVSVPNMINLQNCGRVWIESNNGGAMFEKMIRTKTRAPLQPFHQGANKESRILTAAALVNSQIIFPIGWESRFPQMFQHLTEFLRDFSANKHDDGADVLTGIYEKELADGNAKPYTALGGRGITRKN